MKKNVLLVIMDGWGVGKPDKFNAIDNAKTPNLDYLTRNYPNTQLLASGIHVGLPEGQMGTSEVNHQVIGSGRILLHDLPRVNNAIEDGSIYNNKELNNSIQHAINNKSNLHFIGILSDGKVHVSMDHLFALLKHKDIEKVSNVYLHMFADGRDTAPKSLEKYFRVLDNFIAERKNIKLGSLQGRFYLDRDRDWNKTKQAIDLIFNAKGMNVSDWKAAMNYSYNAGISDEYMTQYSVDKNSIVKKNDSIIFFHYRSDRMYQIVKATLDEKPDNVLVTSLCKYSDDFDIPVMFKQNDYTNTLAEVLAENKMKQCRITETEKYTHLTYFFNGGMEKELPFEDWKRYISNRFYKPYYNFEPSMQAFKITKYIQSIIKSNKYNLIVVNYPNTDMVGHCGNYNASVIAAESVDYCVGKLYDSIKDKLDNWAMIVTADHGNSEEMWDYVNNQPHTQHTLNPVPCIVVTKEKHKLTRRQSLEDIAPTILEFLGLEKPEQMTGTSLISR